MRVFVLRDAWACAPSLPDLRAPPLPLPLALALHRGPRAFLSSERRSPPRRVDDALGTKALASSRPRPSVGRPFALGLFGAPRLTLSSLERRRLTLRSGDRLVTRSVMRRSDLCPRAVSAYLALPRCFFLFDSFEVRASLMAGGLVHRPRLVGISLVVL